MKPQKFQFFLFLNRIKGNVHEISFNDYNCILYTNNSILNFNLKLFISGNINWLPIKKDN